MQKQYKKLNTEEKIDLLYQYLLDFSEDEGDSLDDVLETIFDVLRELHNKIKLIKINENK